MTSVRARVTATVLATLISVIGCAGDNEEDKGAVRVTARADLATRELATDDGWAIRLTALKLTLRDVQLGALSLPGPKELDLLARPGAATLYAQGRLAGGSYTNASFVLERVRLAGSGSKAGVEKHFDWSFDGPIHYVRCRNQTELPAKGEAKLEITVQPAALFRSSLVPGQTHTSFQSIADADGNGDGHVIGDELWAKDVTGYELGDQKYLSSLWEFIIAQLAQLGHVDDDARCEILAL